MKQISLSELVAEQGQTRVARGLGVSPAAISKALSAERRILVTLNDDGTYSAEELRPFPSQVPKQSAA